MAWPPPETALRQLTRGGYFLMSTIKITGLFIYPVKSMKGVELQQAQLTAKGLLYDRRWMVVRSNGRFVTQREMPQMSLVHTSLDENGLVLSRQGHGSISVPFNIIDGEKIEAKVWKDICETVDQGEDISRWLTQALSSKHRLRLVRMSPEFIRPLDKASIMGAKTTTEFADAAPYLVANEASLDRLNAVLKSNSISSVPMNRFRPNIVVQGLEPFAEHKVATLSADSYQLKFCYPCKRCIITTINQNTAEKDPNWQPFKTLATINPAPGEKKAPAFAENVILTRGYGHRIAVGNHIKATFK